MTDMINTSDVEVVDFHVHRFGKESLLSVVKAYALRHKCSIETELRAPWWRSFVNYLAGVYGCNPP